MDVHEYALACTLAHSHELELSARKSSGAKPSPLHWQHLPDTCEDTCYHASLAEGCKLQCLCTPPVHMTTVLQCLCVLPAGETGGWGRLRNASLEKPPTIAPHQRRDLNHRACSGPNIVHTPAQPSCMLRPNHRACSGPRVPQALADYVGSIEPSQYQAIFKTQMDNACLGHVLRGLQLSAKVCG